jgi:hypothetical protein
MKPVRRKRDRTGDWPMEVILVALTAFGCLALAFQRLAG